MREETAHVDLGGGLEAYLAAADETAAELLESEDSLVAPLRQYDLYFRTQLWSTGASEAMALNDAKNTATEPYSAPGLSF